MNLEFTDTNVSLSLNIGFGYVQNTVKNEGEMIEFTNGSDYGSVHFVKATKSFLFMFNAKGIISQKSLRTFRDKLMSKIEQYNLVLGNV